MMIQGIEEIAESHFYNGNGRIGYRAASLFNPEFFPFNNSSSPVQKLTFCIQEGHMLIHLWPVRKNALVSAGSSPRNIAIFIPL